MDVSENRLDVSENDLVSYDDNDISFNDYSYVGLGGSFGSEVQIDYSPYLETITEQVSECTRLFGLGIGFALLVFLFYRTKSIVNKFNFRGKGLNNE